MIDFSKESKIMVVAAHPDDEILGCGATVHKYTKNGVEAHALVLGTGVASRCEHNITDSINEIDNLRKDAKDSADIIGFKTISFEDFPDNKMDSVSLLDVVRKIEFYASKLKPSIILTHHHGDLNVDHRMTFNAVITAFRPLKGSSVNTILCFETPSSTEWNFPYYKNSYSPNVFIDIKNEINVKLKALECYKSEICQAPHPRSAESIQAIAQRWGNVAGFKYAEAFELIMSKLV